MKSNDLKISVIEIKGTCPVYRIGQTFYIKDGYILDVKSSANVCMHSLTSFLPYYVALSKGVDPASIGLTKDENNKFVYLQCLDPCIYTNGGTVIFQVEIIE